jgi:hypothetical protein
LGVNTPSSVMKENTSLHASCNGSYQNPWVKSKDPNTFLPAKASVVVALVGIDPAIGTVLRFTDQ